MRIVKSPYLFGTFSLLPFSSPCARIHLPDPSCGGAVGNELLPESNYVRAPDLLELRCHLLASAVRRDLLADGQNINKDAFPNPRVQHRVRLGPAQGFWLAHRAKTSLSQSCINSELSLYGKIGMCFLLL